MMEYKRYANIIFRLQTARLQAGLSQSQVATMLGLEAGSTISHYENGHRKLELETFLRLAEIYGVSETWLLTGHNPDFNEAQWLELTQATDSAMHDLSVLTDLLRTLRKEE